MTTARQRDFRRNGRLRSADEAARVRQRISQLMPWRVGDTCRSADGQAVTRVAAIDGERITLENGDELQQSKMQSV